MRVKYVVLLSCIMGLGFLYGCSKPTTLEETAEDLAALEDKTDNSANLAALEEAAANYEAELIMSKDEVEAIEWSEDILPYMEYDWLGDANIERYYDTSWIMQLADLNLDGQQEMLVTLPIYSGEDLTFVYTVEDENVVYCGKMIAGTAYDDNDSFMTDESYLPSNVIDVYQNESGEVRYLSSNDFLEGGHGYYQIYENTFDGNNISCEPLIAINFFQSTDGNMNYQYAMGDWLERESEESDDKNYSAFGQVMREYMEGYEKADVSFAVSEFRVPGIVEYLPEDKKEIVRNNIKAGFATQMSIENAKENEKKKQELIEEAIAGMEECLPELDIFEENPSENGEDEVVEGIHVLDVCQGDIGNDNRKDMVVVLEYWTVYSEGKDGESELYADGMLVKDHRTVCVFTETEPGRFECIGINQNLINDSRSGGLWGDPYAGIEIQDGLLTISVYAGSADRWGDDYTFGMGENNCLVLYKIRDYWYNVNTGEGEDRYYDYQTWTAEKRSIEEISIVTETYQYSFTANDGNPILFENTLSSQWMYNETDSVTEE